MAAKAHLDSHHYVHKSPFEQILYRHQFIIQDMEKFLERKKTSTAEKNKRLGFTRMQHNAFINEGAGYSMDAESEGMHTDLESEDIQEEPEVTLEQVIGGEMAEGEGGDLKKKKNSSHLATSTMSQQKKSRHGRAITTDRPSTLKIGMSIKSPTAMMMSPERRNNSSMSK